MSTENTTTCRRCARPVADGAHCCTPCVHQTEENLDSIAEDVDDLDVTLTRQDRVTAPGSGRHATDEAPLPINLRASDVGHRLRNTLTTWARVIIDERGFQEPDDDLAEIARFIRGVTGWIARQEWGPECFDDIGRVAVDLARAIDTPPPMIALGTCDADDCDGELRAHPEAPWTKCPACRTAYDVAKRRDQLLARADQRRFGAARLARILTALGDRYPDGRLIIRPEKWITNRVQWGKLRPVDRDQRGRPLYRLGDARRLHDLDIQQAILKAAKSAEKETAA
ncbi:hypothetical protein [Glycomyces arizonensis]|uniref:hypothetical protein n=1 Tax=Glycomyces arizonensis TaxID=256035 RepID=UPI0004056F07|nr:hypothetical protein [Glycomyces arizonensis]